MARCLIPGCAAVQLKARGLCQQHYDHHWFRGTLDQFDRTNPEWFVNPMVCDCAEPDPDSCCGMCRTCKRKPLALMAPKAAS